MTHDAAMIDRIRSRCEDVGECLEFQSRAKSERRKRHPLCSCDGKVLLVRRVLYGDRKPTVEGCFLVPRCGNPYCVKPEHQKVITDHQRTKMGGASAADSATRAARVAATRNARGRNKLTPDQAREILASPETGLELAARMGVHPSTVSQVRRGKTFREHGNPFAGLGARP